MNKTNVSAPKNLKDNDLNQKVKNLAAEERKLTKEILLYIAEVDKRRLYLKMAYPSLFEYLIKEIGYSAGAAHRRIDAARLILKVPEVSDSIESGRLHLSQISKVQKICRHIKKESGQAVEVSLQKDILQKIENKTSEQTDLILAQEFQTEVKVTETKLIQRDESVRIELTLTKEEAELLKKAQELLSNKTGGGFKNTLIEMADRIVKSYELKHKLEHKSKFENKPKPQQDKNIKSKDKATFTSTVEVENIGKVNKTVEAKTSEGRAIEDKTVEDRGVIKELKSVTPRLKKEILQRDQSCQFVDSTTGKICGAKHFLEIDHIQPRYLGGLNTPQNLRALCKKHNLYRYRAGFLAENISGRCVYANASTSM